MRSHAWVGGTVGGIVGLLFTMLLSLPPLEENILLGASIGLLVVGPIGGLALTQAAPVPVDEKARLQELFAAKEEREKIEHERVLQKFDSLIEKVEKLGDSRDNRQVGRNFDRFMRRLTSHYPVWDSEGRLRTYVLMQKVSEVLSPQNAESYLDLVYSTLVARGVEASEMSHMSLSGKVEKLYNDPGTLGARNLAGTLLLMNRADEAYAMELVSDAIHLWSGERFDRLLPDFRAIRVMPETARQEVEDLLQKEMAKAKRAGNIDAVLRSKQILETIISSGSEQLTR